MNLIDGYISVNMTQQASIDVYQILITITMTWPLFMICNIEPDKTSLIKHVFQMVRPWSVACTEKYIG